MNRMTNASTPQSIELGTPRNQRPIAIGITALALFVVGALLSLFTGRNAIYSGLRMLLLGSLAGGVTYVVGHFAGVSIG